MQYNLYFFTDKAAQFQRDEITVAEHKHFTKAHDWPQRRKPVVIVREPRIHVLEVAVGTQAKVVFRRANDEAAVVATAYREAKSQGPDGEQDYRNENHGSGFRGRREVVV